MSIRPARLSDLEAILAIYAPYITDTAISFEYSVPTLEEFTQRFAAITAQFPWLVWEEDGQVKGYAYASAPFTRAAYRWCASLSVYLLPEIQGKGIGRSLCHALEQLLINQGYHLLYAIVTSENAASLSFHEAIGFRKLAYFPDCAYKFGRCYGIHWLEKRLKSIEIPSKFPASFPDIVNLDRNSP